MSKRIMTKPGGNRRTINQVIQLSTTESEETVLKDAHRPGRYGCDDEYFTDKPNLYQQHDQNYGINQRPVSPNSRPQSTISDYSNYSLEGDMKEKDLRSLALKLSNTSQSLLRANAINLLIDSSVTTIVHSSVWNDLSEQIKLCLTDEDIHVFQASFKLTSNIVLNSETVKEGFIVLLEGCLQMSHKKLSVHYNTTPYPVDTCQAVSESRLTKAPFLFIADGINLENSQNKRDLQMMQLLVKAQRQISKHWLRWKEPDIQDVLENFIDFLSMQIEYSKTQKDKINLLHILSILDPSAKWLEYWLFNIHIARRMIKIIRKNYIYFSFLTHMILEHIHYVPKGSPHCDAVIENTVHETQVRLCLFLNCLSTLGLLLKYEKIHNLFPISTNISKNLSLNEFLKLLIRYLNENRQHNELNSKMWYNPVDTILVKIITDVLSTHTKLIPHITNALLEPVENITSLQVSNDNKLCCLKIFKEIIAISDFQNLLSQNRSYFINTNENDIAKDDSSPERPPKTLPNRSVDELSYFQGTSPTSIILNLLKMLLQRCNLDQKLYNAEILIDLLYICSYFLEIPKCSTLLTETGVLDSLIKCYIRMHNQSNVTNDIRLSNVLQTTDKLLMKLCYNSIGQPRVEAYAGVVNILVKRMINKPKFSCLDMNFIMLVSHLGSSEEMDQIFEHYNLFEDILLELWSGIKSTENSQLGCSDYNNERKLQDILNMIHSISCNLNLVQSATRSLYSDTTKTEFSYGVNEEHFPTALTELISHLCQSINMQCEMDPQSFADLTQSDKSVNDMNITEKSSCNCLTTPYDMSVCFVALEVLKALITNLDVMLYLNNRYKFQDNLLSAQSLNIQSNDPIFDDELINIQNENSETQIDSQNKLIILDELSILRHQILWSSGYLGGPKETAPRNYDLESYLEDHKIPRLFSEWPSENCFRVRSTSAYFGRRNFLEEFLWLNKADMTYEEWLAKTREKLKMSEDIKYSVLVDLLNAIQTDREPPIHLLELSKKEEYRNVKMFEEDYAGIDLIIRYGLDMDILQDEAYHKKNLTYMLQLCYKSLLVEDRKKFQGFDWFVGVVFVICEGNVARCKKFLQKFLCLPCAPFFWATFGEALTKKGHYFGSESLPPKFALMHAIEIIMEDNVIERNILQYNGISWLALSTMWLQQCYLNIIDLKQLIRLIACCIVYPSDFLAYYSIAMLSHLSDILRENAARRDLWPRIKIQGMIGFSLDIYYTQIEEMGQKYQDILLPLLELS